LPIKSLETCVAPAASDMLIYENQFGTIEIAMRSVRKALNRILISFHDAFRIWKSLQSALLVLIGKKLSLASVQRIRNQERNSALTFENTLKNEIT
jgi:hypothetical protein